MIGVKKKKKRKKMQNPLGKAKPGQGKKRGNVTSPKGGA